MQEFFETDLLSIKEQIKNFLKTQDRFKDYNFDGSAINDLLNILAYTTQYQNLYLNFTSNELFLNTAQIDDNVYKLANTLNYIPKRKSASWMNVDLQRSSAVTIVIPKYSTWTLGNLSLTNLEDIIINTDSVYTVRLYEGEFVTETFVSDGTAFQEYELSEKENIDNDNLFVYVDEPDGAGGYIVSSDKWVSANLDAFDTGDKAYFIQYFDQLSLKFDDGNLFEIPSTDSRVRVIYLKTNGLTPNGSTGQVELTDAAILNKEHLNVTSLNALANGVDEESVEAIKLRAPQYYTTLNRAITERDYNILFGKYAYYDTFHSGTIWGGEKEYIDQNQLLQESTPTKDLGHIFITAIKDDYSYLQTSEINDIKTYLDKYKIITLFFKFLHPTFININPTVNIKYDSVLDLDLTAIESQINTFLTNNNGFNKSFYLSDVVRYVDSLNDIIYTTIDFTTSITVYNETHKIIRLNNEIVPSSVSGIVNGFTLEDDGIGNMEWNSVVVGSVNYSTGFITLDQDFGVSTYDLNFQYNDKNAIYLIKESFLKHSDITLNIL